MVTTTFSSFIGKLTFIRMMVRIFLTTFPAHFSSSTSVFIISVFFTFITSQKIRYKLLEPLHCIAYFNFCWNFWCVKCHYINVWFYCFTFCFYWNPSNSFQLFLNLFYCIQRQFFAFHNPWWSGICKTMFLPGCCGTWSFSVENVYVSSFSLRQVEFHFSIFLYNIGVKLSDITFTYKGR